MAELHLHADRLRLHAATAAALSEDLRAGVPSVPDVDPRWRPELSAERERLRGAALVAVRELAELSAALSAVAAASEAADGEVARCIGGIRERLDTVPAPPPTSGEPST